MWRMCSGVVPQHPPTMCAPVCANRTAYSAIYSGVLKDVRIPRAKLGPCPVCGHEIVENRKGYSCWARDDPGCGFVIWKAKAGKTLPLAIARELIRQGYTEQAVTGFRGRSGRSFRAHLALSQTEEGKWRVEFDELWAKEGAKPPEAEAGAEAATTAATVEARSAA